MCAGLVTITALFVSTVPGAINVIRLVLLIMAFIIVIIIVVNKIRVMVKILTMTMIIMKTKGKTELYRSYDSASCPKE